MRKRMLDTNAVRALVDGDSPRLDGLFAEQRCCISVIVAAEILGWHWWGRSPAARLLIRCVRRLY